MDLQLNGKTALVTGSTAGIGYAIAERLAREGAAQMALARGLAETTAGTGITVNSILPGPTRSEGVEVFIKQMAAGKDEAAAEEEFFRAIRPSSLRKRFAAPGEIAPLVAYVCSPLAAATNGAALRVDGGVVRSIL